ncbi:ribonuclease III [Aurantimonas sp. VKM B-3413]|uniref:ribonuclease III n=1 Tax=Aurantimonas sp. VKM B-3413 TaxID=2779401 RepID=UPI001E375268|nr:ribonuclease III [Aurantimonas sp. VKM B-3413]MCB8836047.1 ribonuclease III [Aurantimonas sp. VKM B-3413]
MARLTREKPLEALEERIGVRFQDRTRFERALTHSSLRSDGGSDKSYERLEFLGDRVLGLVIAEKIFAMFPKADEGELSLRLNALVSAETCAEIADEIGLFDFVRQGGDLKKLKGERTRNIRADLVESLIAAIYLGEGMETARDFITRHWGGRLDEAVTARRDAKTALQEWAHRRGPTPPRYEIVDRTGPDHEPLFTVRVLVDGVEPAEGQGRSKRLAEQNAAETVLRREAVWKDED